VPRAAAQNLRNFKIAFVTDRNREQGPSNWATSFGAKTPGIWSLSCGEVRYSPDDHRSFGDAYGESRISIYANRYLEGQECLPYIPRLAQETQSRNVLVLIHGYNYTFANAIESAVAFAEDTDFNGLLLVWSWPSEGSRYAYEDDLKANGWSRPHFVSFFKDILRALPGKIDFIAHSMGSHILLKFALDMSTSPHVPNSIIFAAPDVDQEDFKAKEKQVTGLFQSLYAFSNDWAVWMSKKYNGGLRAGEGGEALLVMNERQIETIDADAEGHGAIFADPSVLQDFVKIWETHQHAARRGLIEKARGSFKYWRLAR
jgi:esterase/lipase superfamily enzyme